MKVLVIAPHMDDEVLGVGGTIARHVCEKDQVYVVCVAHRVYHHKFDEEKNRFEMECARNAQGILGYKEIRFLNLPDERLDVALQEIIVPLERIFTEISPEVVYLNHRGDNHQDHRAVFQAAMIALRPAAQSSLRRVLCYETPSSTEQSPPFPEYGFFPNCYVNITSFLEKKMEALSCYKTELREFPHPRSKESVRLLAQKRGVESGFPAAEAFVIVRDRWE